MEEVAYETSIFDETPIPAVYAGFWSRFGALFVDGLILTLPTLIINFNQSITRSLPLLIIVRLAGMAYKPVLEYLYGATPGKKAMSIAVVNLSYNKPNLKEALLRNIFGITVGMISLFYAAMVYAGGAFRQSANSFNFNILQSGLGYAAFIGSSTLLIYLADTVVFFANKQNRALHDLIGKTYVIKK